ncbi:MAG: hypothetical protein JWO57_3750 [Pseudonocardiales bacterium]|nr:hypothetical protein [Pseudonocardiales bacterium]
MLLPRPRGPLTERLVEVLAEPATAAPVGASPAHATMPVTDAPLADDDLQLALWVCYELHYRGFDEVDPGWEWDPDLLALRRELERTMLAVLRRDVVVPSDGATVPERLKRLVDGDTAPSLAGYLVRHASWAQFEEFAIHRSIYHLKEADPHSWAIPRLAGPAKAALVEIQADEYGSGVASQMHSELFRATLRGLGLSDSYGHYVADVPAVTLAVSNLMSLFGLHRELRGALVGHLAAFEMTSSAPNRRYSQALRRLGGDQAARRFYDEHVTADALHEQLAVHDLCGSLAADEPDLAEDILFGAACCLYVDTRFAEHVLRQWQAGRSSLRSAESAPDRLAVSVS